MWNMNIYWLYQEENTVGGILTCWVKVHFNLYGEINVFTGGYC